MIAGIVFASCRLIGHIYVHNKYSVEIESYWDLADKASTIEQKSEYIEKYYNSLIKSNLYGVNSAIIFDTPNEDFTENLKALNSLRVRLQEIKHMDPNTFEYQTALQQITEQEQGQANHMIDVFRRCWEKEHYYTFFNLIIIILFGTIQIIMVSIGWFICGENNKIKI